MTGATSLRAFRIGLYEEHLEEAAFLYAQRQALIANPELSWSQLDDFERRLEAHLDALVVGGELALQVARERAAAGDPGEMFAAVCVVCRHGLAPSLAEILRSLRYEEPEQTAAVGDALKLELPESWQEHCVRAVRQGIDPLKRVLAGVIGHRRLPVSLAPLLGEASPATRAALLWAIGRTREDGAARALRPFYDDAEAAVQSSAMRAGLRVHDAEALARLRQGSEAATRVPLELALGGSGSAAPALLAALRRPGADPRVVTALGVLGDLSSVRVLIDVLSVESLAPAAAEALHVITGAPLLEDVFVPDPLAEDELFDKELREYRASGALPHRGDGQPFGSSVRRLSRDAATWQAWLQDHAARFTAGQRYRSGRPCGPDVLLDCLVSDTFPKSYRGLAADELLVRYGIDARLEVDMPVAAQRSVLRQAAATVGAAAPEFEPGRWYTFTRL